jgi:hypothetical protein
LPAPAICCSAAAPMRCWPGGRMNSASRFCMRIDRSRLSPATGRRQPTARGARNRPALARMTDAGGGCVRGKAQRCSCWNGQRPPSDAGRASLGGLLAMDAGATRGPVWGGALCSESRRPSITGRSAQYAARCRWPT